MQAGLEPQLPENKPDNWYIAVTEFAVRHSDLGLTEVDTLAFCTIVDEIVTVIAERIDRDYTNTNMFAYTQLLYFKEALNQCSVYMPYIVKHLISSCLCNRFVYNDEDKTLKITLSYYLNLWLKDFTVKF